MTRLRILTAIPLAVLALSAIVAAGPADAARHGKQHHKHHRSKSPGHRAHTPKIGSVPAQENPAEGGAAAEAGPATEPAAEAGAVALIVRTGPGVVPKLPELGPGVAAQIVDSGSTGDGEATDEDCEQFAEEIASAEWRQFVGETYGSPELATQGAEDAARLEDEGTDQGCFFVYE